MAPRKRKFKAIEVKGGRWAVYGYYRGKKWQTSKWEGKVPFYTREMGEDYASRVNEDFYRCLQTGEYFDPYLWFGVKSFIEYAEEVFNIRKAGFSVSGIKSWRYALETFGTSPSLKDCALKNVRYQQLEAFVIHLSTSSNRNLTSCLAPIKIASAVLKYAHKRNLITEMPPLPGKRDFRDHLKAGVFRDDKRPKRAITTQAQATIITYIEPWNRPIFKLGCYLGCRLGELRALRWEDVEWERRAIWIRRALDTRQNVVQTKTEVTVRMLPLNAEMVDMLQALAERCKVRDLAGKPHGWIFLNRHRKPYKDGISKVWTRAVKRAGVPYVSCYNGIRHSKASQLANEGWPVQKVQAWMGHASYLTTDAHYVQQAFLDLREMV